METLWIYLTELFGVVTLSLNTHEDCFLKSDIGAQAVLNVSQFTISWWQKLGGTS